MSRATLRTRKVPATAAQLARAAHWHADHGMAVFPVVPGTKYPAVKADWEHEATTSHARIGKTWRHIPYNIGVAARPSGLLVVDLDTPKNPTDLPPEPWHSRGATCAADILDQLAAEAADPLPRTHTVTTPSGGRHLYFRPTPGLELGNTAGRLGWKIDTRGHGGYVLAAGSTIDGRYYRLHTATAPQHLPDWITARLTRPLEPNETPAPTRDLRDASAYAMAALTGELDRLLAATEGCRNDTLNATAFALGQLMGAGYLDHGMVHDELVSAAARIGLPRSEAERTIASGMAAGARQPRRRRTQPT
jgi:hypothetical protein